MMPGGTRWKVCFSHSHTLKHQGVRPRPFLVACFHSERPGLILYLALASLSRLLPICVYTAAGNSHKHNCVHQLFKCFFPAIFQAKP